MPYIIIHSTNERVATSLRRFSGYKNRKENPTNERKGHPDLIGYKMPNSSLRVLKDTPETRIYAASLLFKAPYDTMVMFSEDMNFIDFNIKEQELGKLMAEGKISISDLQARNKQKAPGVDLHLHGN